MERMFSATEKEEKEVLNQVAGDIQKAKEEGAVDTDELKYEKVGDNQVSITDKANNETTIAEVAEDGNVDLYNPEDQLVEEEGHLDGFLHPEVTEDEVIPGEQTNPTESVEEHLEEGVIAPNRPDGGKNPEAGCEKTAEEIAAEGPCNEEECEEEKKEEKEFSVYSDNTVIQKIFSQQEYCEMLFSDIINSEEAEDVAKVGNLKIEKIDEDTVIVSDLKSGDQAKVKLSEEDLEVEELGKKDFSEEGEEEECQLNQLQPLHVVGVDTGNHILIDSPVIGEEAAEDLSARLTEAGVDGVQILTDETEARDYISELLDNLGVESQDDIEETQEATFSDVEGNEFGVYVTRYYSSNTVFMDRLFSEASHDIEVSQAKIEDAIENGDEIETESEIVTPISSNEAVIEDKDNEEFTKVTLNDDNMDIKPISKEEAENLMEDIAVSEEEVDEDAEANEANEVVEDAEDEAEEAVEDADEAKEDIEDEEKDFSDIYTNEAETKFFSENEPMTQYMIRLFSDEENEEKIEEAIENGDKVETDTVVITPVDSETAIIEDKDNGEFTKAIISEEDIDVTPISEEEANSLTEKKEEEKAEEKKAEETEEKAEDAADGEEEKKEEKEESKGFSNTILDKWFAEVVTPVSRPVAPAAPAQAPVPVAVVPAAEAEAPAEAPAAEETPSIEAIEDKAIAAVQQIQAAAAEAEAQILNAKAAPTEEAEADLQEAQFSEKEKTFSENDTLVSWLNVNTKH